MIRLSIILFVSFFVGSVSHAKVNSDKVSEERSNDQRSGRFKLLQLSDARRDQFLIDSNTGKIWGHFCAKPGPDIYSCNELIWKEERLVNLPKDED